MTLEKLETKLERSGDCLLWRGAKTGRGIGQVSIDGKAVCVHRLAFTRVRGPIPRGMDVRHTCGSGPLCCEPSHMELVPHAARLKGARRSFGEKNGASKLTASAVTEIRKSEETQQVLAQRFGVSVDAISRVRRRLTWTAI